MATGRPADLAAREVATQALFELDEDGLLEQLAVVPLDRNTTCELAATIIGQPPSATLVELGRGARGGNRCA